MPNEARFHVTFSGVPLAGPLTFIEAFEAAKKLQSRNSLVVLHLSEGVDQPTRWVLRLRRVDYIDGDTPSIQWLGEESPLSTEEIHGIVALLINRSGPAGWRGLELPATTIGLLARELARTGDPSIAKAIITVTCQGSLWAAVARREDA